MIKAIKSPPELVGDTSRAQPGDVGELQRQISILTDGMGYESFMNFKRAAAAEREMQIAGECPVCFEDGGQHAVNCSQLAGRRPADEAAAPACISAVSVRASSPRPPRPSAGYGSRASTIGAGGDDAYPIVAAASVAGALLAYALFQRSAR